MDSIAAGRRFLRSHGWDAWRKEQTDQRKNLPPPPFEKPCPPGAPRVDLVTPQELGVGGLPLIEAIRRRCSRRQFSQEPLTLEEVSFLLWATQGVRETPSDRPVALRTVPSAGGRHPFETYLVVNRVEGLEPGLYRYLPLEHQLCSLRPDAGLGARVGQACNRQTFVGQGAVIFVWTVLPYRSEWRYGAIAHKVIAIDAGHVCQNLYLAAEAIGAGTCAIAAYNQRQMDELLAVDGDDEFTIYVAPVGRT